MSMNSRTANSIALFSVGTLVLAAVWIPSAGGQQKDKDDRQALIKKGAYLVNEVARCGDCHTPRDARGKLDMTRHLQGAAMWFSPTNQAAEFEDEAPNITMTGKAGKWSEDKMTKFMTSGSSDAPMPAYRLTEEDARAVAAYLRSLAGDGKGRANKRGDGIKRGEREREREDDDD
jgi:mono/diheme cytochrome c family protein